LRSPWRSSDSIQRPSHGRLFQPIYWAKPLPLRMKAMWRRWP